MSRALDDLSPAFRPLAFELLARCAEARVPVIVVNTRRTQAEQVDNLARGVSWTLDSRHLTGDAIDLCPYQQYMLHGTNKLIWVATDPVWEKIGQIGERIGLVWGGRWTRRDLGHFEIPRPVTPAPTPGVSRA